MQALQKKKEGKKKRTKERKRKANNFNREFVDSFRKPERQASLRGNWYIQIEKEFKGLRISGSSVNFFLSTAL
jgi:hypothetical protein